jgi:hypothetical protein
MQVVAPAGADISGRIERAGALSPAKLSEIDDALRACGRRTEWTPAAAARLSEIKDSSVPADSSRRRRNGRPADAGPDGLRSAAPRQQDHDLRLDEYQAVPGIQGLPSAARVRASSQVMPWRAAVAR